MDLVGKAEMHRVELAAEDEGQMYYSGHAYEMVVPRRIHMVAGEHTPNDDPKKLKN
jgi:hypothetical protein